MAKFAREKLRRASNSLIYGVLFVGIAYIASLMPSFVTRLYTSSAPVAPHAQADVVSGGGSDGYGGTGGDAAGCDGSDGGDGSDCGAP